MGFELDCTLKSPEDFYKLLVPEFHPLEGRFNDWTGGMPGHRAVYKVPRTLLFQPRMNTPALGDPHRSMY